MISSAVQTDSALLVTVGMLNGQIVSGTTQDFSPFQSQFEVRAFSGAQSTRETVVVTDEVAWVAFHRSHGAAPVSAPDDVVQLTIHTVGAKAFAVLVRAAEIASGRGFYGWSPARESSWERVWFSPRGIVGRERPEPIGELLLRSHQISPDDLQAALAAQAATRAKPIGQILLDQKKINAEALAEATRLQARKRARLGEILVEAGLVSQADVDAAVEEQRVKRGRRLGEILTESGLLTERALAETLAHKFNLRFVDLDTYPMDPAARAEVPPDVIRKYSVLPVAVDELTLTLVVSDPLQTDVYDLLGFLMKRRVVELVATPTQLKAVIASLQGVEKAVEPGGQTTGAIGKILQDIERGEDAPVAKPTDKAAKTPGKPASGEEVSEGSGNVVRLIDEIVVEAARIGASDIHVEQYGAQEPVVIRLRVDGECRVLAKVPGRLRNALVARLKIMADLDISERRKPQDGKIVFKAGSAPLELRMATLPTVPEGEDVVLRLLAASKPLPMEKMGFSPRNLAALQGAIKKPYGLLLCVGPTGSGKTTTLHSILGALNTDDTKIWTAEDPVEITQPGLRQVQVHARIGLTFAAAMRAFLRADPDVIMVGEMRDHETASTAVEASLTGHFVLSTLHTNNAPETVTRLLDMGLDPFSFADSLEAVLAQRLARRLCANCREKSPASADERAELERLYGKDALRSWMGATADMPWLLGRAKGCDKCAGTGYKGRVALHELLVTKDAIKAAIQRKLPVDELRSLAVHAGMATLIQDGIEKVLAGDLDLAQVLAVCSR
jgi:type II secretory ATPase GspE/PulE/Tfp pilus assembly ATPase PilB-like protein